MENEQIALVKEQVGKALSAVESIVVSTDETMLEAGDIRKRVKTVGKMIKEEKEKATKPLNETLKTIKGWFAPIEADYEKAEEVISQKMLSYQKEQEEKARKIEEENKKKFEERNEKSSEPVVYEKPIEVIKKSEDFHTRTVAKMRITDPNKIPDEYWMIDEVKLRKDVVAGKVVDGAEYYEEKIIV